MPETNLTYEEELDARNWETIQSTRLNDDKLLEAVEKATRVYGFCPNRVWAMIESSTGKESELHALFPPHDGRLDALFSRQKHQKDADNAHSRCTFDFCEQSLVDSTSVEQRHESLSCTVAACTPINRPDIFPAEELNKAAKERRPTAWHLYGRKVTLPHQKYMAISHVWSDGTGTGKRHGAVNKCLFDYFRNIALDLGCEGIWWDTLCIPNDPKARSLAIRNMHENYSHAEVTVVHDCYIRELAWIDAETACLAIALSPWFSRGWTALELARSRVVKVLFKGKDGYITKDLEDDILNDPQTTRHRVASEIIRTLRTQTIDGIDDLLCVLRSRHTSWNKDMAVISALLVGVNMGPSIKITNKPESEDETNQSARNVYQQDIFERVVIHIGSLEYGHLFHNLPTMFEGTSWCPAKFLSLPPTYINQRSLYPEGRAVTRIAKRPLLKVDAGGNVIGTWKIFPTSCAPVDKCDWRGIHPLIAAKIRSSLMQKEIHQILVEPSSSLVARFLVVRKLRTASIDEAYQFIGSAVFAQPEVIDDTRGIMSTVRILHRPRMFGLSHPEQQATSQEETNEEQVLPLKDADTSNEPEVQTRDILTIYESLAKSDPGFRLTPHRKHQPKTLGEFHLLCAVREGRESDVYNLLRSGVSPRCYDEDLRSPMSWAASEGHAGIVKIMLDHHREGLASMEQPQYLDYWKSNRPRPFIDHCSKRFEELIDSEGVDGRTPLAWAAMRGHLVVVKHLILRHEVKIDSEEEQRWTPLSFAVAGGHERVAKLLIDAGASVNIIVSWHVSILGLAVMTGRVSTVKLLLDSGAAPGGPDRFKQRTPIDLAAKDGNPQMMRLLIERGAKINAHILDCNALCTAAARGHVAAVKLLLQEMEKLNISISPPSEPNVTHDSDVLPKNALVAAVLGGRKWSPWSSHCESTSWSYTKTELAENHLQIVRLLLDTGYFDVNTKDLDKSTPIHKAASRGYEKVLFLLIGTGQAKLNAQDYNGLTPLHSAARSGHAHIVRILLHAGASANIKTKSRGELPGQTPMDMAREYGHETVAELLKAHTSISNRLMAPIEKWLSARALREEKDSGLFHAYHA